VRPEIVRRGLRLPGWTGTGRSRSGASPHVSHGKVPADCGRMGSAAPLPLVPVRHRSVRVLPCDRSRRRATSDLTIIGRARHRITG